MSNACVLGIDLGGTKISGAIVDSNFSILYELTVPSRDSIEGIADPQLRRTKELISALCDFAQKYEYPLSKGCAGFPEYVNLQGELTSRDNIDWDLQPQIDFKALTGFEWHAQSDVRCAGVAEARLGAGRDSNDFVYVTVSSGISHTHFLDGQAVTGPEGEAIGFGLLEIDTDDGKVLLENYSSGLGVSRRFAQSSKDFSIDAKALMSLSNENVKAGEIISTATRQLGEQLALLAQELKTTLIVIGGGLWLGSEKYRELTLDSFRSSCDLLGIDVTISNAQIKNSGVVGAAIYAFEAAASAKI